VARTRTLNSFKNPEEKTSITLAKNKYSSEKSQKYPFITGKF